MQRLHSNCTGFLVHVHGGGSMLLEVTEVPPLLCDVPLETLVSVGSALCVQ